MGGESKQWVAVTVLVFRGGRMLSMRRSSTQQAGAGLWEGVSGRVQVGEDPIAAARREVQEETGLEVVVQPRPVTAYAALRRGEPMTVDRRSRRSTSVARSCSRMSMTTSAGVSRKNSASSEFRCSSPMRRGSRGLRARSTSAEERVERGEVGLVAVMGAEVAEARRAKGLAQAIASPKLPGRMGQLGRVRRFRRCDMRLRSGAGRSRALVATTGSPRPNASSILIGRPPSVRRGIHATSLALCTRARARSPSRRRKSTSRARPSLVASCLAGVGSDSDATRSRAFGSVRFKTSRAAINSSQPWYRSRLPA